MGTYNPVASSDVNDVDAARRAKPWAVVQRCVHQTRQHNKVIVCGGLVQIFARKRVALDTRAFPGFAPPLDNVT